MTRIVCDTMIWYELGKGKLKLPDPSRYTLVCTYLSLMELAFTANNFRKLDEVQSSVNQIFNLMPELILKFPFDHARTIIDKNYRPNFNIEEDLVFGFLIVLLNSPKEGLLDNEFKGQLLSISTKRKENSDSWSKFLNNLHYRPKEIKKVYKNYYSEEWLKSRFQDRFVLQLYQLSEVSYSPADIDWTNFEFYQRVYMQHYRNLRISNRKVDSNDENDLKNMIYVQATDLYWTLEKRWLSIAKETKLENHLYFE